MAAAILSNTSLEVLKIDGNRFKATEMAFILIALTKRQSDAMQRIDMSGIGAAVQDSLSSINKALPKNENVTVLSLADNALNGESFANLLSNVCRSFPYLGLVDLSLNSFDRPVLDALCYYLNYSANWLEALLLRVGEYGKGALVFLSSISGCLSIYMLFYLPLPIFIDLPLIPPLPNRLLQRGM